MNKDVIILIKGMHFQNTEDGGNIETIWRGQYYKKKGTHYIVYEEPIEGTNDVCKNMIKFDSSMVNLSKKGPLSTVMLFKTGEKNLTNYNTPFGSIVIGIDTHHIRLTETDASITIDVNYSLDVNYEHLAKSDIHIDIRNVGDADFIM